MGSYIGVTTAMTDGERGLSGLPLISVITPAYRASKTVARAVRSVCRQSFDEWEMIVVDDGSDDDTFTCAIEAAAGDSRVHVIRQQNAGTGAARNRGLSEATGTYVIFLDADDELMHDYMERQLSFASSAEGAEIIGCNVIMRDSNDDALWSGPDVVEHSLSVEELLVDNTISVMALVRRDALESVGGLNSVYAEDYDLWLRLLIAGYRHRHQPRVLGIYYRTPGSKSSKRKREWIAVARMLRNYRRSGVLTSGQAAVAKKSQHRFCSMYARVCVEECLLRGDFKRARRLVLGTRRSFGRWYRFVASFLLTWAVPNLYAGLLRRRPSGYTPYADVGSS